MIHLGSTSKAGRDSRGGAGRWKGGRKWKFSLKERRWRSGENANCFCRRRDGDFGKNGFPFVIGKRKKQKKKEGVFGDRFEDFLFDRFVGLSVL